MSMTIGKATAIKLSKYLQENKISVYKFALNSGIPESTIKMMFERESEYIRAKTLILIAHGMGLTTAEFFSDPLFNYENLDLN